MLWPIAEEKVFVKTLKDEVKSFPLENKSRWKVEEIDLFEGLEVPTRLVLKKYTCPYCNHSVGATMEGNIDYTFCPHCGNRVNL